MAPAHACPEGRAGLGCRALEKAPACVQAVKTVRAQGAVGVRGGGSGIVKELLEMRGGHGPALSSRCNYVPPWDYSSVASGAPHQAGRGPCARSWHVGYESKLPCGAGIVHSEHGGGRPSVREDQRAAALARSTAFCCSLAVSSAACSSSDLASSVLPSLVSSSPRTLGSRCERRRAPSATRRSTIVSAAAGPVAMETATARLSSTTGLGARRPNA